MKELGPEARALIRTVGDADGPTADDRHRVQGALFGTLAGAAITGSTTAALGASSGAAMLSGVSAKGGAVTAQVAIWLVAGAGVGIAVAAPVALYTGRPQPAAVAQAAHVDPAEPPRAQEILPRPPRLLATTEGSRGGQHAGALLAEATGTVTRRAPPPAFTLQPREAPVAQGPSIGSEVELLKRAQRELAAGNASASLAVLDDHAQRFATGALRAERLAARVFALCELGQVEAARAAAREFLSVAADSPLVPRVAASCAGSGAARPRR